MHEVILGVAYVVGALALLALASFLAGWLATLGHFLARWNVGDRWYRWEGPAGAYGAGPEWQRYPGDSTGSPGSKLTIEELGADIDLERLRAMGDPRRFPPIQPGGGSE